MKFADKTVYEIYVRSFCDANGDGIGDLLGIISKLDYLKDLGVDYLWLMPIYPSPQNDNGYDIADYYDIDPLFGTMGDMEQLIAEAEKRQIGIILDMVFNHTSTDHVWFQKALMGEEKYQRYYFFQDGKPDKAPTNWQSKFGGSAWKYVPGLKKWYLHLFDESQADLNWENPEVREEVKEVIRFWKKKGIQGFRFDVINLISKPEVFTDDPDGDGKKLYTDGRHVHAFLKELSKDTGLEDMLTVGEMSATTIDHCVRYTNPAEKELSMCFSFHHLKVDYKDGDKWKLMKPDYQKLKYILQNWQKELQDRDGWEAVFWENHDQPRSVSRFGCENKYWKESAKMLAVTIHLMRGTPYIYQGEEIGMTNPHFQAIGQYRDVESKNYYHILTKQGKTPQEALNILADRSRDNGRTPMQWTAGKNAGFTQGTPWIPLADNYAEINVEKELQDPDSIFHFYKRLVRLRKERKEVSDGTIVFLETDCSELLAYERNWKESKIIILCNLSGTSISIKVKEEWKNCRILLDSYLEEKWNSQNEQYLLREYEALVLENY